jgi:hypothetical protein
MLKGQDEVREKFVPIKTELVWFIEIRIIFAKQKLS